MDRPTTPNSLLFFLDSSAIVNGANLPPAQCRTTPEVVSEFQPGGATRRRLDLLLAGGLEVLSPSAGAQERARRAAQDAGSLARLSPPDLSILALAVDGGGILVSDDYTVQDVARRLGIRVQSVATRGITDARDWMARCEGCGRRYEAADVGKDCPVCGAQIRARVRRASR